MSLEALRARYGDLYAPKYRLEVGDAEFDESTDAIEELTVETSVDGADRFAVTFAGRFDARRASASFPHLDWDLFEEGAAATVSMGYGNTLRDLFVGSLTGVRAEYPSEGTPSIQLSGYGRTYAMTNGTNTRSWDETTDADVVEAVAADYDFADTEVESTDVTHPKVVQDAESDYQFLQRRAGRNGYELFARTDVLRFGPPSYDAEPTVTLQYGSSLSRFRPEVTTAEQVSTVEVRHWDPTEKSEIVGTADNDGLGSGTRVLRVPVRSDAEADAVAEGVLERLRSGVVSGHGETVGIPDLAAGSTVEMEGLGERFSRSYYVQRATHRVGASGYRTSFDVRERAI